MKSLLFPLLLLALSTQAQTKRAASSPGHVCEESPLLAELSKGEGLAILGAYGYDWKTPWACTMVESPWAIGATILRFRKVTAQTDDETAFSILKVQGREQIWIIPTEMGMLEVPHADSDPHNVAAFNVLLQLHKGPIDAAGWIEAGKLYMAILGHKEALLMKADSGNADACSDNGCSVAFSDRPVVAGEAYNKWTLAFAIPSKGQPGMLTDVSKETVKP